MFPDSSWWPSGAAGAEDPASGGQPSLMDKITCITCLAARATHPPGLQAQTRGGPVQSRTAGHPIYSMAERMQGQEHRRALGTWLMSTCLRLSRREQGESSPRQTGCLSSQPVPELVGAERMKRTINIAMTRTRKGLKALSSLTLMSWDVLQVVLLSPALVLE